MNGEPGLHEQEYSTTVRQVPDVVAEHLGYDFVTEHVCMDCGCRVGAKSLVRHAREHKLARFHAEQGGLP